MPGIQRTISDCYIVGEEVFRTKNDVTKRVRDILHAYRLGQMLGSDHFTFILDLLRNHPRATEKIGCGVSAITVEQNPRYRNGRGFLVSRSDGTTTDFSYNKCITPVTAIQYFSHACREVVSGQIQAYKKGYFDEYANEQGLVQCPITREWVNKELAHVDHIQPQTFQMLVDTFIKERRIDRNTVEYRGLEDGAIGREFADEELAAAWAEYHRKNAKLQVISRTANLSIVKRKDYVPKKRNE